MKPTMDLSRNEKLELFMQGLFTAGFISVIYLGVSFIFRQFLLTYTRNPVLGQLRDWFLYTEGVYSFATNALALLYVFLTILITSWNVRRRWSAIRIRHILDYVSYMAAGNYDVRIPLDEGDPYEEVSENVNILMDSIENALEEQRKSEKSKDELISNIGHDIRTPLTSVIGYLGLLENKSYHSQEEMDQYVSVAYRKAVDMQGLVNDLFEYASSVQTSSKLNIRDVQIEPFFEQIAAGFMLEAEEKEIQITTAVADSSLMGEFDPDKMARVMNNLVSNALKYGFGATDIVLTSHSESKEEFLHHETHVISDKLRRKTRNAASWLILEVRNNGELLSEDELDKIFDRSYRGDHSRSNHIPGSGLGLSIVKNFITLHDGQTYAYIDDDFLVFRVEIPQNGEPVLTE